MKRPVVICVLLLSALPSVVAAAPFSFVSSTSTTPDSPAGIHGIAQVGNQWFMANFTSGWNVYDLAFTQIGTTTTR